MGYFGYVVMVLRIFQVWMYEYFGVGPEIWEEIAGIFPRFLCWLPKHHLSIPTKRSLEIWRLVIDNLTINDVSSFFFLLFKSLALGYASVPSLSEFLFVIFQMNLNPWVGCEGYAKCERALELNGCQVLFECGHGKYWYLGDRVLPQVEHVYPPTTIPTPPCCIVQLAYFLADEEIARVRDGYIVAGAEGNYAEFVQDHLQGCLVGIMVFSSLFKVKFLVLQIPFPYFCLVTIFACWTFSLLLLKEGKRERKRKRFLLLTMLVALLDLSSFSGMVV